ncbi:MAG: class I SAM-dependent methyltransferase [Pirellulales bacterium]
MPSSDRYELLDFGDGRKLERFGRYVLDRESPAATEERPRHPRRWPEAHARYERHGEKGRWRVAAELPDSWQMAHGPLRFELKRTDFGHVGLFAEQAENWKWLTDRSAGLKLLNLFAYTGGSTLAAAAGGAAEVVHVDAARNVVGWARRNAELSGLADAPVRWISEDARKFVERELRRGNRYDAVVLDPPSFGHGPKGEVWTLQRDLPGLLRDCGQLVTSPRGSILLTCHTTDVTAAALADLLREALPATMTGRIATSAMALTTADGRRLESGVAVRWTVEPSVAADV